MTYGTSVLWDDPDWVRPTGQMTADEFREVERRAVAATRDSSGPLLSVAAGALETAGQIMDPVLALWEFGASAWDSADSLADKVAQVIVNGITPGAQMVDLDGPIEKFSALDWLTLVPMVGGVGGAVRGGKALATTVKVVRGAGAAASVYNTARAGLFSPKVVAVYLGKTLLGAMEEGAYIALRETARYAVRKWLRARIAD